MDLWDYGPVDPGLLTMEPTFENLTFKGRTLGYWSEAVCGVEGMLLWFLQDR